jgi:hypothetical protein
VFRWQTWGVNGMPLLLAQAPFFMAISDEGSVKALNRYDDSFRAAIMNRHFLEVF